MLRPMRPYPLMATRTVIADSGRGKCGETRILAYERRQLLPAIGDFGVGMHAEPLALLAHLDPAHCLVEKPRAVRLEHPEIEAEMAVADEMPRALAHQRPADAAPLRPLEHVERVDL